jgi:Lrp/AsnC family transcriptional regulator, leucine-responsive regulatory protein
MDENDRRILSILQENSRTTNAEIGRALGLAPSAILERIRKLERRGVLRGFPARLDPAALGLELLAFVHVQADDRPGSSTTAERLAELSEIQEIHHVAGEDCLLVKVRCASPVALGTLLRERIGAIPEVRRTRTTIVLETVKETLALPIGVEREGGDDARA